MTNAVHALRRRWRARQQDLCRQAVASPVAVEKECLEIEWVVLDRCIRDLLDTVDGVRPLPLNEASTEKLYKWAGRMVTIMDLMIAARDSGEAESFADLADQDFLNDMYDLMKQLANRRDGT